MALTVTAKNFEEEVLKSTIPVVIDVFADWCGPCKQMMPIYDELASELTDTFKLVKLNLDDDRDLAVKYNVSSVPTFIFIKDGEAVGKETGYMSKDVLKAKINDVLG